MPARTFVGFGCGAIQAGLFLFEARQSGAFDRLVVAEVVPEVVAAVRAAGGFAVNVAGSTGVVHQSIDNVEILNPCTAADRARLIAAVADAREIATALPSIDLYATGSDADPAAILRAGFARKVRDTALPSAIVYTAENHNHAAELLAGAVGDAATVRGRVQYLNTVIGKMSGVVTGAVALRAQALQPVAAGLERAFLVEQFNRILVSRINLPGFQRSIGAFEEKDDLLPFEYAKLYGHNAAHALLGYLLHERGAELIGDAREMPGLLEQVRSAFIDESGAALCHVYAGADPLFTAHGFDAYVDDLLERMLNPWLRDTVARVTRDPARKLGWDDRLIGTMRLTLRAGITPTRYARGAAAAVRMLADERDVAPAECLAALWPDVPEEDARVMRALIEQA